LNQHASTTFYHILSTISRFLFSVLLGNTLDAIKNFNELFVATMTLAFCWQFVQVSPFGSSKYALEEPKHCI